MKAKKSCEQELEELKKEYEHFIYIVSHDIKAPLRAISNLTAWIEDDIADNSLEDVKENMDLLKERVKRVERMMNALLELSRVSRFEIDISRFNIKSSVDQMIKLLSTSENFKSEVEINVQHEEIHTYSEKLNKVLLSLIENALFFNDKEEKEVKIKIEEKNDVYQISVTDNGPGIPEELQAKIFDIFYTVNAKDALYSVGAGLSISKKICEEVGGKLEIGISEKEGSVFSFSWPRIINNN